MARNLEYLGNIGPLKDSVKIGKPIEITIKNLAWDSWEFIIANKEGCHWELEQKAKQSVRRRYPLANVFVETFLSDPYANERTITGKYQAYFDVERADSLQLKRFIKFLEVRMYSDNSLLEKLRCASETTTNFIY